MNDIFGPGSNFSERFVPDYDELGKRIQAVRQLGKKIVLTSGTFDIHHVGHSRYLEKGKELAEGGILVVGIDSDEKVRKRKGENRPIVPEQERMEVLCHLRHVDLVTLKLINTPKWELIRVIRPDVLLITDETYDTPERLQAIHDFCAEFGGKVVKLPPQATTSTTAKIRLLIFGLKQKVKGKLEEVIKWIDEI
ncbi:MAG: adenylyltransferase/cytidyltransferase family protein [Candidatus Yanofskybacteria bacterium]|nr:adenylyltransferase/cytidyltransferase family protein [Candidatus Yanofskybacteria bacterium]